MPERRIAVVMFTDMVGYSKMMHANEERALELLREHNEILESHFKRHKGKVIKTIGDAFMCEFASAGNAIEASVAIQAALAKRNANVDGFSQIEVRIGIHAGEVTFRDNDIFGDGVNIASRIESVGNAGDILFSSQVHDQLIGKSDFKLHDYGPVRVKNIAEPVHIYSVLWDPERPPQKLRLGQNKTSPLVKSALATMGLVIAFLGFFLVRQPEAKPALVIAGVHNNTQDAYLKKVNIERVLSDALVQKFYNWPSIRMVSPLILEKALTEKKIDVAQLAADPTAAVDVAKSVTANLVLRGSLRREGSKYSLKVDLNDIGKESLVDTSTVEVGRAKDFLGTPLDKLVNRLQGKIRERFAIEEEKRVKIAPIGELTTYSLEAYGHFVTGYDIFRYGEFIAGAKEMEKAVAIDKDFALAYSEISCAYSFGKEPRLSEKFQRKALKYKDRFVGFSMPALLFKGNSAWLRKDAKEAMKNYRLITELYPDEREGYIYLGLAMVYLSKTPADSIAVFEQAIALTPGYFPSYRGLANAYVHMGQRKRSIEITQRYIEDYPDSPGIAYARQFLLELKG